MRIVYHLGAHCTDEERLLRCLLKNRAILAEQGIVVPGPTRYRTLLRETAVALKGQPASLETQSLVLDQIMDEDAAERLILSWDSFLSFAPWVMDGGLYRAAGERVRAFSLIFPQVEAEFHLALRNPATFLPALFDKQKNAKGGTRDFATFLKHRDPQDVRWSEVIDRMLQMNPDVPLTIWCDEDTPLIWPEVLQAVSGHAPGTVLEGRDELLAQIMSADGLKRMQAYLDSHAVGTPELRRKVTTAFLDKFAVPDRITVDVEVPDWTDDLVDSMTLAYDQDVALIRTMPGVTFIDP
ncbi:MAG: hypothetical protein H7317_17320 [Pseudorhodobacter sp.]|nr:hypothetical protein [Pseudorhodobacter sp.]